MYCTIFLEVVHLEANIPVSLLSHPAKIDWVFPNRQADVGRRRCKTCSQSNQTLNLVTTWSSTCQICDSEALYLHQVWWRPPSWWALHPLQQCGPSGRSGSGCGGPGPSGWGGWQWDRLLSPPAWGCHHSPQLTTAPAKKHSITTWSSTRRYGWHMTDWWASLGGCAFDIFLVLLT